MDRLDYEIATAEKDFISSLNAIKIEIENCRIDRNINLTQYTRLLEMAQARYRTLCAVKGD